MISILLVEDDQEKARAIAEAILTVAGVEFDAITHVQSVVDAKRELQRRRFDLLLLDINLPTRIDRPVKVGAGLDVLRAIGDGSGRCHAPTYVIGLTAHESGFSGASEEFSKALWKLVQFAPDSAAWRDPVLAAVAFVRDTMGPPFRTDGATFHCTLGVVVGLEDIELDSIKALDGSIEPLKVAHDPTRYFRGVLRDERGYVDVIIAAAPRMGLVDSAVAATRLVETFRPRYLAMTGICAGVREKTDLGDIIIADPCWDWGSGKLTAEEEKERFKAAPYQIRLDASLRSAARDLCDDEAWLQGLYVNWAGGRPDNHPKASIGPVASGASVLQRKASMDAIREQHKNLFGVEMEIYAVMNAALLASEPRPIPIGIKAVCDFGEEDKGDKVQRYAAYLSANFLKELALRVMATNPDVE
jgi:nucleoside phosphorylase/CheY-like chemotaxis protein